MRVLPTRTAHVLTTGGTGSLRSRPLGRSQPQLPVSGHQARWAALVFGESYRLRVPGCGSENPPQGRLRGRITGALAAKRGCPAGIRRPGEKSSWLACAVLGVTTRVSGPLGPQRALRPGTPASPLGPPASAPNPSCGFSWLRKRESRRVFLVLAARPLLTQTQFTQTLDASIRLGSPERRRQVRSGTTLRVHRAGFLPVPPRWPRGFQGVAEPMPVQHGRHSPRGSPALPDPGRSPPPAAGAPAQPSSPPKPPAPPGARAREPEPGSPAGGGKGPVRTSLTGHRGFRRVRLATRLRRLRFYLSLVPVL